MPLDKPTTLPTTTTPTPTTTTPTTTPTTTTPPTTGISSITALEFRGQQQISAIQGKRFSFPDQIV